jgi:hypothetical protein
VEGEFCEVRIQHHAQPVLIAPRASNLREAGAPSIAAGHKTSESTSLNAVDQPA